MYSVWKIIGIFKITEDLPARDDKTGLFDLAKVHVASNITDFCPKKFPPT